MIFSEIFISTKGMPSHFMMTIYRPKWRGGCDAKDPPCTSWWGKSNTSIEQIVIIAHASI